MAPNTRCASLLLGRPPAILHGGKWKFHPSRSSRPCIMSLSSLSLAPYENPAANPSAALSDRLLTTSALPLLTPGPSHGHLPPGIQPLHRSPRDISALPTPVCFLWGAAGRILLNPKSDHVTSLLQTVQTSVLGAFVQWSPRPGVLYPRKAPASSTSLLAPSW